MEELFPIVDELGNVIGSATRKECHARTFLLHPVVHLHVFDEAGRLFLQKRSESKDVQPGKWDTSVGGHVDFGESVEVALRRETREELGLSIRNERKLYSYVFQSDVERELVNTFCCEAELSDITIDPVEISEGRFWTMEEIRKSLGSGCFTPNFELEFAKLTEALGKGSR